MHDRQSGRGPELIHPTAIVDSQTELGEDVEIGPYAVVGPHVHIGAGTRVLAHVYLDGHTTIGKECEVYPFASIGTRTQDLKFDGALTYVAIGDRTIIREYVTVNAGTNEGETTRVGDDCLLMAYSHVAHACAIGNRVVIANCGTLAGDVVMEDDSILGGLSGIHQFTRIGRMAIVGGASKITQDCPPYMLIDGHPASVRGINRVGLERKGVDQVIVAALKETYRTLYRKKLAVNQALDQLEKGTDLCAEVRHVIDFIRASKRGIIR